MGRPLIDLTGQTFGRLKIIQQAGFNRSHEALWLCICSCQSELKVSGNNLRSGNSQSCGCLKREVLGVASITHGHTRNKRWSPEYRTWVAMMARCRNPNHEKYRYYGGAGREVYAPWHNAEVFISYLIDHLGRKPAGMILGRIDNKRGYFPGNIRWATLMQQAANRRRRRKETSAMHEPGLPIF